MTKKIFIICLLTLSISLLLMERRVYSFGGCEEDCQKCHSITTDEVRKILDKMKAVDAKINDVKMSQVTGLWQVSVEDKGRKGIFYVPFSKKYIISGSIIEVETSANKTQETLTAINKPSDRFIDISKIPVEPSIVAGDKNAEHKVFIFTDPDCPYCLRLHGEIKKVLEERKDIAFFLKLMPLQMHPEAYWKSQSIMCRDSLQRLEDNFDKKPIPKPDCDSRVIDDNMRLASDLGITGTPTIIMPDGQIVVGMRNAKAIIEQVINSKRSAAK